MKSIIYLSIIITAIIIVSGLVIFGIVSFLKKSKKADVLEHDPEEEKIEKPKPPKIKSIGVRKYPKHNNRKRTKGRKIQYVNFKGISKPIYHDVI